MRTYRKFVLAAFTAVFALSLGVGTAAALRSIELRAGGAITANARALTFTEPAGIAITSNVTLSGSLNTRIAKTVGAPVGEIRTCTANEGRDIVGLAIVVRIRCELNRPWPITYNSIKGTLPNIVSVLLIIGKPSFLLEFVREGRRVNECLYGGTAQRLLGAAEEIGADTAVLGARREFRELLIQTTRNSSKLLANLEETIQACAREGRLTGTFNLTAAQTVTLV